MSWVRVWIHLVFSTKNREPFLNSKEIRKNIFKHIKKNAEEKGIWLDCINGYHDHVHCLISLNKDQTISKVAQLIKGESSFWINQNKITDQKFVWQDDYWAVSVSESHVHELREYIYQQEEHHTKKTFAEEVKEFMINQLAEANCNRYLKISAFIAVHL
ncbi:MAG: IS200/IS605 family transposase [Bacteroidota bacterium]|nr:IS200/IS605 family transposase [Bacteroidota bacterium]